MTSMALQTPTPVRRRWRSALILVLAGLFLAHIAGGCVAPSGGDGPAAGVSREALRAVSGSAAVMAPAIATEITTELAPVVAVAVDVSREVGTAGPALFDFCCDDCAPAPACCDTLAVQAPGVLLLALLLVVGWAWLGRNSPLATVRIARRASRRRLKSGLFTVLCVSRT